jgi:hypothetical protein
VYPGNILVAIDKYVTAKAGMSMNIAYGATVTRSIVCEIRRIRQPEVNPKTDC